jgi:DNA modification methylase
MARKPTKKPAKKPARKPTTGKSPAVRKPVVRKSRATAWSRVERIDGPGGPVTLYLGDCTAVMAALAPEHIHAVVTDPPYELGFMGKAWDKAGGVASQAATWELACRLLKPGGHLAAFAGSRTYHRIACAIDDAGFEIRDQLMWLYGSGFPKSHDVSKCIDKAGGVHRGKAGKPLPGDAKQTFLRGYKRAPKGAAVFDDAITWDGWGTALKPAHEPIALGRKRFTGTVAANVLRHGTGAVHIDAARVGWQNADDAAAAAAAARVTRDSPGRQRFNGGDGAAMYNDPAGSLATWQDKSGLGRWPANVLHDGSLDVISAFPAGTAREATRFFYSAKASRDEREFGMAGAATTTAYGAYGAYGDGIGLAPKVNGKRPKQAANVHPTVKPVDLMRWLCRLLTCPGGIVLDPFMGSGSTGIAAVREGYAFTGIEQSPEYFDIALRRIRAAVDATEHTPDLLRPRSPVFDTQMALI